MELSAAEKAVKEYFESRGIECTENVPRVVLTAVNLFIDDLVQRTGVDSPENVTPDNIVEVINETPELSFLKQLIPQIKSESV